MSNRAGPIRAFLAAFTLGVGLAIPANAHGGSRVAAPVEASGLACGTELTEEDVQRFLDRWNAFGPPTVTGAGPYFIPITAHIVRASDGTGGLPLSRYEQAMADANAAFAGSGIVLYTAGPIDFLDSDAFYTGINTLAEINLLRGTNVVPNTINVYFTENLSTFSGGLCGISSYTTSPVQGIVMRNDCTGTVENPSTYPHEIGHYFDLFHTHDTQFGVEYVDRSNCLTAGDLLCDTDADPGLSTQTVEPEACSYQGGQTDPNGDPYMPDGRALMSFSWKHCRDFLSPDAEARAVATLIAERPELLANPVGVEPAASGPMVMSLSAPRPNPARSSTELTLAMERPGVVDVTVYDVRGARVRRIASGPHGAGEHRIGWDGTDEAGEVAAPGIYFARLTAFGESVTRKIGLAR